MRATGRKNRRRASGDLFPILEQRKNEFQSWCYAGRPEVMRRIIPDFDTQMEIFEKLSFCIPEEKFRDPVTIKEYGKNLRKAREDKGFTRKDVVSKLKICGQNLAEIEDGKRKEIDRDLLLLLCGIYHKCPEVLLGMEPFAKDPLDFFAENESEKANLILERLYGDAPTLLHTFLVMSELSPQRRTQLVKFIRSNLDIKFLSNGQIAQRIQKRLEDKRDNSGCLQTNFTYHDYMRYLDRGTCFAALGELEKKDPELMNAYMSIACTKRKHYSRILVQLVSNGFLDFPP